MDPSRGDSRYNLNYSSIGLSLADQADLYGNPAAAAALGGRPPSVGLIQSMGGGGNNGGMQTTGRNSGGLMSNANQCQSLSGAGSVGSANSGQSRGIKRTNSDCYDDHHRVGSGSGGMTSQSLQGLESCAGGGGGNGTNPGQQQQQQGGNVPDVVDDNYTSLQNKKSPPANGKKTKGRVKIKMEYIDNKLRRYTTFSKRKTGIMKKAYELSTLTGTQVMLLVASETGHVYTFATRKLQPMITSEAGKQLIQTCLNSPDPPSVGGGDQRMSATGFEETELSYNIADEDSKDDRSPMTSGNESDDSSDIESPDLPNLKSAQTNMIAATSRGGVTPDLVRQDAPTTITTATTTPIIVDNSNDGQQSIPTTGSKLQTKSESVCYHNEQVAVATVAASASTPSSSSSGNRNTVNSFIYPATALSNLPQEVLMGLIQSGHLQLHTEEDGSGQQYITIPLSMAAATATNSGGVGSNFSDEIAPVEGGGRERGDCLNATTSNESVKNIFVTDLSTMSASLRHRRQYEQRDSTNYSATEAPSENEDCIQIKQEIID